MGKKKIVLVLLIDEFGKFLEYANRSQNDEIYFIQELAEFFNDPNREALLITTLHQNFGKYAKGLEQSERLEWEKVKGRLKDLAFDEPVEQLLYFASERLERYKLQESRAEIWDGLNKAIVDSGLLDISQNANTARKLYPLDLLAAGILSNSLRIYGQNERSLFSFIESKELTGSAERNEVFSVDRVFDYLRLNFSSELQDGEKNPHKPQWSAAYKALDRCESLMPQDYALAEIILKIICLVNIFGKHGGILDDEVLVSYVSGTSVFVDRKEISRVIRALESNQIIRFFRHRTKYNYIDGTDVDLQLEYINALKHIEHDFDVVARLSELFELPPVAVRQISYETGIPRNVAYRFVDDIDDLTEPMGEIDGYINVIVTNKKKQPEKIRALLRSGLKCQFFLLYKEYDQIYSDLLEIAKVEYLLEKHKEDRVVSNLLQEDRRYCLHRLEDNFIHAQFNSSRVYWYFEDSEPTKVHSSRVLNQILSLLLAAVYKDVPVFKNELVNRNKLSTPILTARKALIKRMLDSGNVEDLSFEDKKYPPEKTIYLSLLKKTGIHRQEEGLWGYFAPKETDNEGFSLLWQKSIEFIDSAANGRRSIIELYQTLTKPGSLKLKSGFVDFWVPVFLIANKEKYALYENNNGEYIPYLDSDILDLIHKDPSQFSVRKIRVDGVSHNLLKQYEVLTGKDLSDIPGVHSSYISIYSSFIRFYRSLSPYAQKTQNVSGSASAFRDAVIGAKDPEEALFDRIPAALGIYTPNSDNAEVFRMKLIDVIEELRSVYDKLIDAIEMEIAEFLELEQISFPSYKEELIRTFSSVKVSLLAEKEKVFLNRLRSPLDDRMSYLKSLGDFIVGKSLETISDGEIPLVLSGIRSHLVKMQDLIDLHDEIDGNEFKELVQLKLLDSSGTSLITKNVRLESKVTNHLENELTKSLTSDPELNIRALVALLNEEIKKINGNG
ncbi:MAG: hypothetical protein H6606_10320 [Flavobacteriales bacterium]|nr:hypothetical protein [Flavobacteriales bacterium]